ncbi:MAG: polysaccharide biosynthesis/export family protein [Chitinophagaceae bacterium]
MKLLSIGGFVGLLILSSCGGIKKLQYFQGSLSGSKYSTVIYNEPVIQMGDVLSITVFSDNSLASAIYNQPSGPYTSNSIGAVATAGSAGGYLVDNAGYIQFHKIGNVLAKGLTRQALGKSIAQKLDSFLTNAYCQVRFTQFKITVLGEVNHPSVFTVPSEKVSVLEALGLAGDLTAFGRRDSVMIIREKDSERKFGWINMRQTELFNSEFYYLQQNDVIVVHPTKNKAAVNDQILVRNISLAASLISTLAIVYSLVIKK